MPEVLLMLEIMIPLDLSYRNFTNYSFLSDDVTVIADDSVESIFLLPKAIKEVLQARKDTCFINKSFSVQILPRKPNCKML